MNIVTYHPCRMFFGMIAISLMLVAAPHPAQAQIDLIACPDHGSTLSGTSASKFYEFQEKVFFSAKDQMGDALYATDGTPDGTVCLTRDITPISFTSCGDWLYVFGTKPQFATTDFNPWCKYAIWRMKADGTERKKMVDIYKPYSVFPHEFYLWSYNNRIYYSWFGGLSWIDNATGQVTQYYEGSEKISVHGEYDITNVAQAADGLFFMGTSSSKENFYFTDLVSRTAVPLALVQTVGTLHPYYNMRVFNNKGYILQVADSSQLVESDGTREGTRIVWKNKSNIANNSGTPFFSAFIEFQGKLIFDLPETDGVTYWHALYSFDGNQVQLIQKHPENGQNLAFIKSQDALTVFVTTSYQSGTNEIWQLDSSGYHQKKTITFPTNYRNYLYWKDNLIIFGAQDSLRFLDDKTLDSRYTIQIQAYALYMATNGIYFNKIEGGSIGDPCIMQLPTLSVTPLKQLICNYPNATVEGLFPLGDQLYFRANTDSTGKELWVTNGNSGSTRLVKEINTATGSNSNRSTNPTGFTIYGNQLLFTATGVSTDYMRSQQYTGLWATDGSETGTVKLEDLMINENPPDNTKVVFKDRIWFIAQSKTYGDEWRLWVSDGHPGGAQVFETDCRGWKFNRPYGLTVSANLLYFYAFDDKGSLNLWATDGTEAGTHSINDLIGNPNVSNSIYNKPQICATGNRLYFTLDTLINPTSGSSSTAREIWVTDGTQTGTQCLANYNNDYIKDLYIDFLGTHKGNLVFTYVTPQDGFELWYSEGTRSTTRRLTGYLDTESNPDKSFSGLASLGDYFFFTGYTEENGLELYRSDGTPEGTGIFMELAQGQLSSRPHDLTVIGDKLLFFYNSDIVSDPLWITDGTLEGTEPLPWNDHQLCNIHDVHFWQHALYFVASHPETGEALYRYELPGTLGTKPEVVTPANGDIHIYPNPTADVIHIELGENCHFPMTFNLMNSSGSTLKQIVVNNPQSVLSVNDLPAGLYLLLGGKINATFIKK